jgi:hypothetical protein
MAESRPITRDESPVSVLIPHRAIRIMRVNIIGSVARRFVPIGREGPLEGERIRIVRLIPGDTETFTCQYPGEGRKIPACGKAGR